MGLKYCLDVDKNSRFKNRPVEFFQETFFGQLLDIVVLNLPEDPRLNLHTPSTTLLAQIWPCKLLPRSSVEGFPVFASMVSGPEVVNLNTVQCVVGCVAHDGMTYIIDRSGPLADSDSADLQWNPGD